MQECPQQTSAAQRLTMVEEVTACLKGRLLEARNSSMYNWLQSMSWVFLEASELIVASLWPQRIAAECPLNHDILMLCNAEPWRTRISL